MSRHDEIARNDGERTWDRDDGNRQAFRPVSTTSRVLFGIIN